MGGYTLIALRVIIHNKYLLYRSIDHLVKTKRFEEFYKKNSNVAIDLLNGQTKYTKNRIEKYFDNDSSYLKLRFLASSLKIINYSRMSKRQLEKAIDKRRNELRDHSQTE